MRNVLVTIGGRLTIVGDVHDVDILQTVSWRFRYSGNNGPAQMFITFQSTPDPTRPDFSAAFDGNDIVVTSSGPVVEGVCELHIQAIDQDRVTREQYRWRVRSMTPLYRVTETGDQRVTETGDTRVLEENVF